jgi:Na+/H+ antiporter NhaD/arsenite permease-like protein
MIGLFDDSPSMRRIVPAVISALAALLWSASAFAAQDAETHINLGLTNHWAGFLAIGIFVAAYALVVLEEFTHLRKSKPVMLGAALIWGIAAAVVALDPNRDQALVHLAFSAIFLEFTELFFFLLVAMTFVSAMTERNVFEVLRAWLTRSNLSYRALFWVTGWIAFFLSAWLDNLTTALIMSAVILSVGAGNARFISISFIGLVIAANAGGAWNAFGDITTLMVWQAQKVDFLEFWDLFLPSIVNYAVPAAIMQFALPKGTPDAPDEHASIKFGGAGICVLFALTIAFTVGAKYLLHMPPVYGMLTGLAALNLYGYLIKRQERRAGKGDSYNAFATMAHTEWDTLLFFYGVLLCVGGLATIGYLELASTALYGGAGHFWANVAMGTLSAIVDNIPIMYAVIQMNPPMDHGQWLLITLTAGVGGSMLSVGSAAGVALMGQSRGMYTFFSHLKWTWAIALGYALSIVTHAWWNADLFTNGLWR